MFGDFVDCIYPIELDIKDITDTDRSASYLDLHLEIDSYDSGLQWCIRWQQRLSRQWMKIQDR